MNYNLLRIACLFFLITILLIPQSSIAQSRSIHDTGVDWTGQWYNFYKDEQIHFNYPYMFVDYNSGIRLQKLEHNGTEWYLDTKDLFQENTSEFSYRSNMVGNNDLIAFNNDQILYVLGREGDNLVLHSVTDLAYPHYVRLVSLSDDSLLFHHHGVIDLSDPANPVEVSTAEIGDGSIIYGNRLYRHNSGSILEIYDISDLYNHVLVDTVHCPYSNLWMDNYLLQLNDSTLVLGLGDVSGNGVATDIKFLFLSLDENYDVHNRYLWDWEDHLGEHLHEFPHTMTVVGDTTLAVVSLATDSLGESKLLLFDPRLLPENPYLSSVGLPDELGFFQYLSPRTDTSENLLALASNYRGEKSFILNLSDPVNPEVLLERHLLVDRAERIEIMDSNINQLLVSRTGNIAEIGFPVLNGFIEENDLMLLNLDNTTQPDTIALFDREDLQGFNFNICDSLILAYSSVNEEDNFRLYTFNQNGSLDFRYNISIPVATSEYYNDCYDISRINDTYYAVVIDSWDSYLLELQEDQFVVLDTLNIGQAFGKTKFFEHGVIYLTVAYENTNHFLATQWYQINENQEFEFADSCLINIGIMDINSCGNWLSVGDNLFNIANNQLELIHTFIDDSYPDDEWATTISAISENRVAVEYLNGDEITKIYNLNHLSFTSVAAEIKGITDGRMSKMLLDENILWSINPRNSTCRYVITNNSNVDFYSYDKAIPSELELLPPSPNPFNSSTKIQVKLPEKSDVRLSVYNLLGQEVMLLQNSVMETGKHTYHINASSLSSGIYFVNLQNGSEVQTQKIVLLK